jgi:hypothetical protein
VQTQDSPNLLTSYPNTFRRAMACLTLWRRALELNEHGIIHIRAEGGLNGFDISPVAIRGELHPTFQPPLQSCLNTDT